jgi:hypothetical protein
MPRLRRSSKKRYDGNKTAVTLKQRLILLISVLSAVLLVFLFRLGEVLWLAWMVEHRLRIVGLLSLILICLIVASPLILEYAKHPRVLSGPGKNPYIDS